MLRKAKHRRLPQVAPRAGGGHTASAGLLVAVGTGVGNVLAYGFNLVLSRGLGPSGYAELGTLLSVFLIGSVPGMAVQAVNARRLALAVDGPAEELAGLCRVLRLRGLAVGAVVALLFVAAAPAVSALLPSVTTAGVAWTGVSLAANTVFAGYLGIAQGTSRFATMTGLYLAAHSTRLAIGAGAAHAVASPTTVMATQTAAWLVAAVAGHVLTRDLAFDRVAASGSAAGPVHHADGTERSGVRVRTAVASEAHEPARAGAGYVLADAGELAGGAIDSDGPSHGYVSEVLRAAGGLGGILLLTVLDTLLASRYLADGDLGRYNTGSLLARAAFFGPSFVAILAFPRLARPELRRRALTVALAVTGGIGVFAVTLTAVAGDGVIRKAFGAKYAEGPGFDLGAHAWVFTGLGALLALVNLALLDGVARRSHVVSAVVLAGIGLEIATIVGFAHGSPGAIVTAAAACAVATAVVSVAACLGARSEPTAGSVGAAEPEPDAHSVDAVPQTSG